MRERERHRNVLEAFYLEVCLTRSFISGGGTIGKVAMVYNVKRAR